MPHASAVQGAGIDGGAPTEQGETGSGDGGSNREDGSHPEMPPSK